jgi:hypothetical protein
MTLASQWLQGIYKNGMNDGLSGRKWAVVWSSVRTTRTLNFIKYPLSSTGSGYFLGVLLQNSLQTVKKNRHGF